MKVIDHINQAKGTLLSFEILPPLKGKGINAIYDHLNPLMEYKPSAIVIVMRGIQSVVRDAMRIAGIMYEPFCVPHPAFGNSIRFHVAMTEIIQSLPVTDGLQSKGLSR